MCVYIYIYILYMLVQSFILDSASNAFRIKEDL